MPTVKLNQIWQDTRTEAMWFKVSALFYNTCCTPTAELNQVRPYIGTLTGGWEMVEGSPVRKVRTERMTEGETYRLVEETP